MEHSASSAAYDGHAHESELHRHVEMIRARAARLAETPSAIRATAAHDAVEQPTPVRAKGLPEFAVPVPHLALR